ncbi:uncharacterized protein K452DRAFT_300824 [Neofusicoccum parvum]|nr:uncharacterized protein K452DRAFT_300824 [Neofusicoccum parvum]
MGSMAPSPTPDLLPHIIASRAASTPSRVFAITPRSRSLDDGFAETTYAEVGRAIDRFAWWLDENLGGKAEKDAFPTVIEKRKDDTEPSHWQPKVYSGWTVVVSISKTFADRFSPQVLIPLTQNSFEAHLNLVEKTDANTLIGAGEGLAIWEKVKEHKPDVEILVMPELDELLRGEPVEPYPFTKTWEEARLDPIHVNHTSGTTGLPKPITNANVWAISLLRDCALISQGRQLALASLARRKILAFMPPEWIVGLLLQLHMPVYMDLIPVLLPITAPRPLTADYVDRVHQLAPRDVDSGFYVPDLLKQLVKTPSHVAHMQHLSTIFFGGAALDKSAGDALAAFAVVQPVMGATEIGAMPLLATDPADRCEDWDWYGFDLAHYSGVRMRPYADDLHEMVIERVPGEREVQIIFNVLPPGEQEYHTKDLFREHAAKKGRWKFAGRTDDFVKLASMTKFSAGHVEVLLDRHPLVRDTVVGGDGRKEPFVLVQLQESEGQRAREEVLADIWPVFEEANALIAEEIRLRKEMVLFATPDRPFRKAGKGTINRRATVADYEDEIRRMYERVGSEA